MGDQQLQVGEVLRYSKSFDPARPVIDGLRNYNYVTRSQGAGGPKANLEAGINPIREVKLIGGGRRRPAILIRSSMHRVGSDRTPWQDVLQTDQGYIRYFGDNRQPRNNPSTTEGNRTLMAEFSRHTAGHEGERRQAAPLVFFRSERYQGRVKGFVSFQGFGLIRRVELLTEQHVRSGENFANFRYDCVILSMAREGEVFDWSWLNKRRDPRLSDEDVLSSAPAAWRDWVKHGDMVLHKCQRRVAGLAVISPKDQRPARASREHRALHEIYQFYTGTRKHRFEALAADVVAHIISPTGSNYYTGWLTRRSSDGGWDFVHRLDIGTGFARTKIVVLGQAKCENPDSTTGGDAISRTVARLRRGWIGAYVTTAAFSKSVQAEIIEDEYPILLVNGERLAREVLELSHSRGFPSVTAYLSFLDGTYEQRIEYRHPKEILLD